jgi:hypothetical protein
MSLFYDRFREVWRLTGKMGDDPSTGNVGFTYIQLSQLLGATAVTNVKKNYLVDLPLVNTMSNYGHVVLVHLAFPSARNRIIPMGVV